MRINPNFQFSLFNFSYDFFLQVFFFLKYQEILCTKFVVVWEFVIMLCFRPQDAGFTSDLKV